MSNNTSRSGSKSRTISLKTPNKATDSTANNAHIGNLSSAAFFFFGGKNDTIGFV